MKTLIGMAERYDFVITAQNKNEIHLERGAQKLLIVPGALVFDAAARYGNPVRSSRYVVWLITETKQPNFEYQFANTVGL